MSTRLCWYMWGLTRPFVAIFVLWEHGFVLTFALQLVFLPIRCHFAVALALSTCLSVCAFCAIIRLTVAMFSF